MTDQMDGLHGSYACMDGLRDGTLVISVSACLHTCIG